MLLLVEEDLTRPLVDREILMVQKFQCHIQAPNREECGQQEIIVGQVALVQEDQQPDS